MKKNKRTVTALILAVGLILIGNSVRAADEEGPKIYYKDGVHIDSADGNNTLQIQGRGGVRFEFIGKNHALSTDSFSLSRAEIRLEGTVFSRKLKYGFEMNLATRSKATTSAVCTNAACTTTANAVTAESTSGLAVLNDYYFDWIATDSIGIKAGQFKAPFLMQQLTSSTKQQFVDRGLGTSFFDLGRDMGATIHGDVLDYHLAYNLFVMNGQGANELNRNPKALLVGARFEAPIVGKYVYSESDVDYSETPSAGVGVAYAFNERGTTNLTQSSTLPAFSKVSHATIDMGLKYHGFSFQGAGAVSHLHDAPTLNNFGYNAQVGYFIVPKKVEIAGRESGAIISGATLDQFEHAVVANYFVKGHSVKWQNEYAILRNTQGAAAGTVTDHRFRSQVSFIF